MYFSNKNARKYNKNFVVSKRKNLGGQKRDPDVVGRADSKAAHPETFGVPAQTIVVPQQLHVSDYA